MTCMFWILACRWFAAVLCAFTAVFVGCRMLGKSHEWIGKHLWFLCLVTFGVAYAEEAAQKPPTPPPPPTVRGITLAKPETSTAGVKLRWTRDDGSNSVGRTYAVEQGHAGEWRTEATVEGETEATVPGFLIDKDRQWRVREIIGDE